MTVVSGSGKSRPKNAGDVRLVGVDARPLSTPTSGVARVISRVIRHFPEPERYRFFLYSHRPWHRDFEQIVHLPNVVWVQGRGFAARKGGLWFNFALPRIIRGSRLDLFWGSQQVLPPFLPKLPVVLTYYDLVLYFFPEAMRWPARLQQRLVQPFSVRRADRILSISTQTQEDLLERFGYPRDRARVSLLGYDPPATGEERSGSGTKSGAGQQAGTLSALPFALEKQPYILSVSTLEPRKNFGTLLEAYARYHAAAPDAAYPLVIAGRRGWESPEFFARLAELERTTKKIFVLEGPSDAELGRLYRHCAFFCLSSVYEGFGLTLLEALAYGAPSLASDIGPFREIGGDRVEYLPPRDPAAWARAMAGASERFAAGKLGRVKFPLKEWSWDRTARIHYETFEELLA